MRTLTDAYSDSPVSIVSLDMRNEIELRTELDAAYSSRRIWQAISVMCFAVGVIVGYVATR